MRRARVAIPMCTALIGFGLFLLAVEPSRGGCHGGCILPGPGGTPNPCTGEFEWPLPLFLLDVATTGGDPPTNVELYSITLSADDDPLSSRIDSGEVTTFYVASGTVSFAIDPEVTPGTLRVVGSAVEPPAVAAGPTEVAAGGALFLDAQDRRVRVSYRNEGSEEAVLLIASVVPCVSMSPSPPPG